MFTLISNTFHHPLVRASFYGLKRAHIAHDNCKLPLAWQSKDYLYSYSGSHVFNVSQFWFRYSKVNLSIEVFDRGISNIYYCFQ